MRECGVCCLWTSQGDWFSSGNRDRRTGETPMDNFICFRCQEEVRQLREVARGRVQKRVPAGLS